MIRYKKGGKLIPATWDQAIQFVADRFAGFAGRSASLRARGYERIRLHAETFAKEVVQTDNFAISDRYSLAPFFDNLSVPLCTPKDIRYAKTILLIGGEPEEEQTYTGKQIRSAVRNGGATFIAVNDTPIRITAQAKQFLHVNQGSYDAFALAFADSMTNELAGKLGIETSEFDRMLQSIGETDGDIVIMVGGDLSIAAQAAVAASAAKFSSDTRRVLLHPLVPYNNSVGAYDMMPDAKSVDDAVKNSKAVLIAGSLQDQTVLAGKEFVVVQELFETATTEYADVIFPASSFAEVDGTFTNNSGFVQRVRKAIEPLHQTKADWIITGMIAKAMGVDFAYNLAASAVFKAIADATPAYGGLRYPNLKDESNPVQVKHALADDGAAKFVSEMKVTVGSIPASGEKNALVPKIGHKLHRLTTMTSKTPQFHLLAHGNPKPENLLVSPLEQFNPDGSVKDEEMAMAVGAEDREQIGVNK